MVEKIDYIAEAITDSLGERCPEHADGCPTCEAWAQYDALTTCAMIREAFANERALEDAEHAALAAMPGPAVKVAGAVPLDLKSEVEAVFRRHIEAMPYARDIIKRIGFEVVPLVTLHGTPAPDLSSENERLRAALHELVRAVCGDTGFASAVRADSGTAYPWPALEIAEVKARAALERT